MSSTYIDLVNHRLVVKEAIEKFGYQFWGMELFSARPEEPKTVCFDEIDKCQMLIGIYGCRYGFIPNGDSKSITHQEYEYASKKMPCLCFIMDSNQREKCEEECKRQKIKTTQEEKQKLDNFLILIAKRHVSDQFRTPDNLGLVTTNALKEWTEGKRISIDEYMNFVTQKFEEIKTLSTSYYKTKDNDFYITLTLSKENRKKQYDKGITDVFNSDGLALREKLEYGSDQFFMEEAINQRKIIVLGAPGSGKTTLLQHLAYRFARNEMPQKLIPLYFSLSLCEEKIVNQNLSFAEIINNQWSKSVSKEIGDARKNALLNWINTKRCIFLFDGLDEVGQHHNEIIDCIENLSAQMEGDYYIVITSRPVGFEGKLSMDFIRFKLEPIEERQIRQYLNRYFRNEENKAIKLWNSLKSNISIKALATNPFLLTIIAYVGDKEGVNLFKHRVDLYKKAVNKLLKQREIDLSNKELSLLEEVAYHFFNMPDNKFKQKFEDRELSEAFELIKQEYKTTFDFSLDKLKSLLKDTETKSGLFIQVEEGIYAFLHPSFQEYLSACAIAKRSDWLIIAQSKIWESRWDEVLELVVAQTANKLNNEDLHKFFRKILFFKDDIFNTIFFKITKCASQCWHILPEDIQEEIREKLISIWFNSVKYDSWMDKSSLKLLASVDLVLFNKLIDALKNKEDDIRNEVISVLGDIRNSVAIDALLNIPRNNESMVWNDPIISALGKIGNPKAIDYLAEIVRNKGISSNIAKAISNIGGKKAQQILLSALKENHNSLLTLIIYGSLIEIGIEDIVEDVADAITDSKGKLKPWLYYCLSCIANPKVDQVGSFGGIGIATERVWEKIAEFEDVLSKGVKQNKIDLLNNIAEIIGFDDSDFISRFFTKAGEIRERHKQTAYQTLKKDIKKDVELLGVDLHVQNLIGALLTSSDENIRLYYTIELGEIGNEEAIEGLKFALDDQSNKVKIAAADALNKIESNKSSEILESLLLSETNNELKKSIIYTICKNPNKQTLLILLKILPSISEDTNRIEIAKALGKVGDRRAVPYLIKMLSEENKQIREHSIQALGEIGGTETVEALHLRLEYENDKYLKGSIWRALHKACINSKIRLYSDGTIMCI